MKVLQVGCNSVHFTRFVNDLPNAVAWRVMAEEEVENVEHSQTDRVNFREMHPLTIRKNAVLVKRFLKRYRPDVVHIHQINRLAYFVSREAKRQGIPVITTAWGSDVLVVPKRNRLSRFLVRQVLKRSNVVTGDSYEMIDAMRELFANGNYRWLQYGINPVEPAEKKKIIYSNRLHKDFYRIDQVIRYYADFSKEHPGWQLVVAGSGEETEQLKQLVMDLKIADQVEFAGWLSAEENRKNYACSMVYISIPSTDGTAVSLLEALSADCLPVVSDLKVSREWIEDGVNGIIEKEGSNPLKEVLSLDPETCRTINRKKILESATRDHCLGVFLQLYHDVAQSV